MVLRGKKILVTGATGFIGSRLAERLVLEHEATVTGVGRKLDRVPWLNDVGVKLRLAELTDANALRDVVLGQELIFNLAAATGPDARDPDLCQRVNVTMVENLIHEAVEAGVGRTIHVSTMAVYGPPDRLTMSEEHDLETERGGPYGRSKAKGEIIAAKLGAQLGHDVVVIRPGQVFGPRGRSWTLNMIALVKKRIPVLLGGGEGHAHPVFVDNLIDGLILAATHPDAQGEAFNLVDQPLPWKEFFGYYGRMSGRKPWGVPMWMAKTVLNYYVRFSGRTEPPDDLLKFYTNRSIYPISKARTMLAYEPKIDLNEGMKRTEVWLREAGLL